MRTLLAVVILSVLLAIPAHARQVSQWRSSTGSEIQIMGTENTRFQIQVITAAGQSLIYDAWWIEVKNSFGYRAQGVEYYCTYTNKGWSIKVDGGPGKVYQWDFVRWISK